MRSYRWALCCFAKKKLIQAVSLNVDKVICTASHQSARGSLTVLNPTRLMKSNANAKTIFSS